MHKNKEIATSAKPIPTRKVKSAPQNIIPQTLTSIKELCIIKDVITTEPDLTAKTCPTLPIVKNNAKASEYISTGA